MTDRPTRLGEMIPVAARTHDEIAVELQRIQQMEARLAAYTAELIADWQPAAPTRGTGRTVSPGRRRRTGHPVPAVGRPTG